MTPQLPVRKKYRNDKVSCASLKLPPFLEGPHGAYNQKHTIMMEAPATGYVNVPCTTLTTCCSLIPFRSSLPNQNSFQSFWRFQAGGIQPDLTVNRSEPLFGCVYYNISASPIHRLHGPRSAHCRQVRSRQPLGSSCSLERPRPPCQSTLPVHPRL